MKTRFSLMVLSGLAALALSTPARAIDCEKTVVNRTGVTQFGQLVFLFGPEVFTETIEDQPFDDVAAGFFGFDTLLFFSDPINGAVPSTNEVVAPPASVCRTGFSIADHHFNLFGWTWTDQVGQPTQEITDPSFSFRWDAETSSVQVTMRNDTRRTVQLFKGRFSMSFSNPRGEPQVTDPLPPAGAFGPNGPPIGQFPKETPLLTVGDMTLPPFPAQGSVRTFQIPLGGNNDGGGGPILFAPHPDATPFVIFRSIAYFPEDTGRRNPAAMMISDQPLKNYPTQVIFQGACLAGYPTSTGLWPILVHVYAQDPEGTVASVSLDKISCTDPGASASDSVHDPVSGKAQSTSHDRLGVPQTSAVFLVWLRQDDKKARHYKLRFKSGDGTLERTLTLYPSH